MKTCALCQEEVTPRMIRDGSAISRGSELFHRQCRSAGRGARLTAPMPQASAAGGGFADATSFPDIEIGQEAAGFWRRVGAHVVDGFILNIVVFFVAFALGMGGGQPNAAAAVGVLVGVVIPLIYCVWFWVKKGATPGKMMLGLRVIGSDGSEPTGMQSFVRFLGYIPSSLFFGLGYFWMLFDSENRCWHDMMAGTRVVRVQS